MDRKMTEVREEVRDAKSLREMSLAQILSLPDKWTYQGGDNRKVRGKCAYLGPHCRIVISKEIQESLGEGDKAVKIHAFLDRPDPTIILEVSGKEPGETEKYKVQTDGVISAAGAAKANPRLEQYVGQRYEAWASPGFIGIDLKKPTS